RAAGSGLDAGAGAGELCGGGEPCGGGDSVQCRMSSSGSAIPQSPEDSRLSPLALAAEARTEVPARRTTSSRDAFRTARCMPRVTAKPCAEQEKSLERGRPPVQIELDRAERAEDLEHGVRASGERPRRRGRRQLPAPARSS